jgi:hypothetical protein
MRSFFRSLLGLVVAPPPSPPTIHPSHELLSKFNNIFIQTFARPGEETGPDPNFTRPDEIDEYTWSRLAPGMRRLLGTKTGVRDQPRRP